MDTKLFGGTLLVIGTSIGAGMLALPLVNSQTGFIYSTFLLIGSWFVMTTCSLLVLEVNLWLESESNLVSMAKVTLGFIGQLVAWVAYLALLYSILAAYMAGGADFLHHLLEGVNIHIPQWICIWIFTGILSTVVYQGIRTVDYVNRGLILSKFTSFFLLLILVIPFVSSPHLLDGEFRSITKSISVVMLSFGFANIIPTLRAYLQSDVVKLRKAIIGGSLIALVCYFLWDLAIMGTIPRTGDHGLMAIAQSNHSTSEFVQIISTYLHRETISLIARIFTSISLATSFLGVSLCLSDFLADGFQVTRNRMNNILVALATFGPPLLIVLFYPGLFIKALSYAGVVCVILFVIMPVLMAWRGRQIKVAKGYRVAGGKPLLVFILGVAVFVILQGFVF